MEIKEILHIFKRNKINRDEREKKLYCIVSKEFDDQCKLGNIL